MIINKPIAILCPMDSEYEYISSVLCEKQEHMYGNYLFSEGLIDEHPVVAVRCLIGSVNASCAATIAIQKYDPLYMIIQGTAGGHDPELHQNDIVIGKTIVDHAGYFSQHRNLGDGICTEKWIYPGAQMISDGNIKYVKEFHSDDGLCKAAMNVPYDHGKVTLGIIASGNVWNREIDRILQLRNQLGTDCEEMEGFAVAQVCSQFSVPMIDIRIISNSELHPNETFSKESCVLCQKFCYGFLKDVIRGLREK